MTWKFKIYSLAVAASVLSLVAPSALRADSTNVLATDEIYAAGSQSSDLASGATAPVGIAIISGDNSFTFSVSNAVTLDGGNNYEVPSGVGAPVATSSNTGEGSISGITGPGAGYLVGVFVAPGGPSGTAPASLDFTGAGGTSFTSLSPLLDQTFYIGSGDSGTQTFYAPAGATELYLGISDASGYNGAPGAYNDNAGQFNVTYNAAGAVATPEPGSLSMLGFGVIGLGLLLAKRRAVTH